MEEFEDGYNVRNSSRYHTGKKCIESGCSNPAGTAWSPHWCFECNVKRMKRISLSLRNIRQRSKKHGN